MVALFVSLGRDFKDFDRESVQDNISDALAESNIEVNMRIKRIYTILISFVLKVI